MSIKYVFILFCLSLTNCIGTQNRSTNTPVSGINAETIQFDWALLTNDGSIFHFNDSINIYYYENLIMNEFNYWKDTIDENGILKEGTGRRLFIYAKGNPYGLQFDLGRQSSYERMKVDSLLDAEAFRSAEWGFTPGKVPFKTIVDKRNNIVQDIFVSNDSKNPRFNDSIYYYYSGRSKHLQHSLSPLMDSLKGLKFYKVVLVYDSLFSPQYNRPLQKRMSYVELKTITAQNTQEKLAYFRQFKKLYVEGRLLKE